MATAQNVASFLTILSAVSVTLNDVFVTGEVLNTSPRINTSGETPSFTNTLKSWRTQARAWFCPSVPCGVSKAQHDYNKSLCCGMIGFICASFTLYKGSDYRIMKVLRSHNGQRSKVAALKIFSSLDTAIGLSLILREELTPVLRETMKSGVRKARNHFCDPILESQASPRRKGTLPNLISEQGGQALYSAPTQYVDAGLPPSHRIRVAKADAPSLSNFSMSSIFADNTTREEDVRLIKLKFADAQRQHFGNGSAPIATQFSLAQTMKEMKISVPGPGGSLQEEVRLVPESEDVDDIGV